MIHFTCDRCGRRIEEEELRFRVSIEIQVAMLDRDEDPAGSQDDGLEVLHEVLSEFDEQEREEISQFAYQHQHYDLCADCHREYLMNPLGVEQPQTRFGFSEN